MKKAYLSQSILKLLIAGFLAILFIPYSVYAATAGYYTISGYVRTSGGAGIEGVTINGLYSPASTDATGYYSDDVPSSWSGTVTPTKAGYTFSPSSIYYPPVSSDLTGKDYVGTRITDGDYYVDILNGNDSYDGSQSNPWQTLSYAIGQINYGAPGTYVLHVASGSGESGPYTYNEVGLTILQSNLTIKGEGDTTPIVQGTDVITQLILIDTGATNVTIDNLEIIPFDSASNGIRIADSGAIIQNCYIHSGDIGVFVEGANATIRHNFVHDNSCGIQGASTTTIEKNYIFQNLTGIWANGGTIMNNLIYRNEAASIQVGGSAQIYHNTIDGLGFEGNTGVLLQSGSSVIKYNIITDFEYGIEGGGGTATIDYNDLWGNTFDYSGVSAGVHDISDDPLYNDPTNVDFTLQTTPSASPCIDAILDSGDPVTEDLSWYPRPIGVYKDMGAYETFKVFTMQGVGTATIDGVMSSGEWDGADKIDFNANVPGGGTTPATLYVMNDAANLYLALKFQRNVVDPLGNSLGFEFDNNNDGVAENGDDAIVFHATAGFFDDFRTNDPLLCPGEGNPPATCGPADTDDNGTNDGVGAFQNDGAYSVYEMSHPLNSGDTGHDFALSFGDTVGFYLSLRMIREPGNYPNDYGDTDFPGFRNYAKITIVAAPPPYPTLSSPSNGATGVPLNPTLSWNASVGATSYGLQVATDSSFGAGTIVTSVNGLTGTSYSGVSGLGINTIYWWRMNATNADGTSPWSPAWSFTTVAPEINIKQGVTDILVGGSYDFGSVVLGANSPVTFTIENLGTADLNLTGGTKVQIGGVNAGDFVVTTDPSTPVGASGSTTFVITFAPGGLGLRSATVSIANDDSDENPYTFTIRGTGVAPEINVKQGVTDILVGGSCDFGSVVLGANNPVTFTIENLGTADLNLTGLPKVGISGANAADFVVTSQPSSPVAASGSTTFVITFTPGGSDCEAPPSPFPITTRMKTLIPSQFGAQE